jgi:hypothetical protein
MGHFSCTFPLKVPVYVLHSFRKLFKGKFFEVKAVNFAKNQPQPEASVTLASLRIIDAAMQKNLQTH